MNETSSFLRSSKNEFSSTKLGSPKKKKINFVAFGKLLTNILKIYLIYAKYQLC